MFISNEYFTYSVLLIRLIRISRPTADRKRHGISKIQAKLKETSGFNGPLKRASVSRPRQKITSVLWMTFIKSFLNRCLSRKIILPNISANSQLAPHYYYHHIGDSHQDIHVTLTNSWRQSESFLQYATHYFFVFVFFFCHFENMKDDFDYVLEGVCHVCQDFCNEFCSGSVINGLKLPKGIVRPSVTECPVSPCSGHKTPAN